MRASLHALVAVAAVLAVAAASAPAAGAATADVQIRDFLFRPAFTQIEPGDEVRWIQGGSTTHTVTSRAGAPEAFNAALQPGQELRRTFPTAGRYAYHCTIHPEMRGVVQVGPDTTAPALTKVKLTRGKASVRVAFRLSEPAKVSLQVVRKGKVVRRTSARSVGEGARSATVKTSGLSAASYVVRLRAVDADGNSKVARAGTFAVS